MGQKFITTSTRLVRLPPGSRLTQHIAWGEDKIVFTLQDEQHTCQDKWLGRAQLSMGQMSTEDLLMQIDEAWLEDKDE